MEKSIVDYIEKYFTDWETDISIARKIVASGTTSDSIRTWRRKIAKYRKFKNKPKFKNDIVGAVNNPDGLKDTYIYDEQGDTANLSSKSFKSSDTDRVKILADFLSLCEVDLQTWEVERYVLNAWDVTMSAQKSHTGEDATYTNYQIKVWLKRAVPNHAEAGMKALVKKIPSFSFTPPPKFKPGSGIALEMSIFDAHLGKLAWEAEIGRTSSDLKKSVEDYEYVVSQNLQWASSFKPEKIFYVVGQDLLHTDNNMGRTSRGDHVLDVDTRLFKIYEHAFEAVTKGVMMCRTVAPVEIIWIPGNHDEHTSFFLCHALKQAFRNDKFVTVDTSKEPRKARLWGNLLVGWTHRIINRQEAWVNELAHAFPKLWGQSKFREWHFGDQHKKKEIKTTPIFTAGGVTLRQLTALSNIDKWHYDNLYTDAIPGGEAFLWSKNKGVFSNLTAWTGEGIKTQTA